MAREPSRAGGVGLVPATERELEEARRLGIELPQVLPSLDPLRQGDDEIAPIDPATGTQVIEVAPSGTRPPCGSRHRPRHGRSGR